MGFDFIPSGIKLKDLELSLNGNPENRSKHFFQVKNAFQNIPDIYDFIIFDCPPFGGNLTINALVNVEKMIIPVQCQYLGLKGAKRTLVLFKKIKNLYNPNLEVAAILATFYDRDNGHSGLMLEQILKTFKHQVSPTVIHTCVSLAEAPRYRKTIFEFEPKSTSRTDFLRLANEMILKENWQTKELNIEVNTDLEI
jgi:chromosome partitioning protein